MQVINTYLNSIYQVFLLHSGGIETVVQILNLHEITRWIINTSSIECNFVESFAADSQVIHLKALKC